MSSVPVDYESPKTPCSRFQGPQNEFRSRVRYFGEAPTFPGQNLFGSDCDAHLSTCTDLSTPGEANQSNLSVNDTIQNGLNTPDLGHRDLFSPSNEAAVWSAACTEIPGSAPKKRRTSTEALEIYESENENKENLSDLMNDFQINKRNHSTQLDEFQIRKARYQNRESQPSFLVQKDFTPILLGKLGKQISELNFDDHYRFIEVIGQGNFGEVWKAEHNKTKVLYAIKKSTRRFRSSKERDNHLREIRSVAKLDAHDNLVRYFRAWQVRSSPTSESSGLKNPL